MINRDENELLLSGNINMHTDTKYSLYSRKKGYFVTKRIFDILICSCGVVILGIPMLVIALIIFFYDRHSPIYKHERVGKNGKKFNLYKFRSMIADPPPLEEVLTPEQYEQYTREYKIENDPRITPIGAFLRKTSIDELPQMFNILKGEMSLIGPRPVMEEEVRLYGDNRDDLLSVQPGLTGYWQAYARNNAGYGDGRRQQMELYYVHNMSFKLDTAIFFKTIISVLKKDGAC